MVIFFERKNIKHQLYLPGHAQLAGFKSMKTVTKIQTSTSKHIENIGLHL
jgi:hypothetical protein